MRTQSLWIVLAGAVLAGCGGGGTGPRADLYRDLPADYVMVKVTHYLTDDGVRRGILDADTAFVYVDSAVVDLRKVHLVLYGTDGKEAADLVSRTGQLNQRSNAMVARGSVVLVTKTTGDRIETEELHYDPNLHKVWSTVRTTRTQNGSRVTADGFTADDQMRNVEMTRPRGQVQGLKVSF